METMLKHSSLTSEAENQFYYAQRRCSHQWRAFLVAFSTELFRHAQGDDAKLFLRETGKGMADLLHLPQVQSLRDLEEAMNPVWEQTDWGLVRLSDGGQFISIHHYATPAILTEDVRGLWARSAGHVLEGLYTQWFAMQGAAPH